MSIMDLIIIGTDHDLQDSDRGLKDLIAALSESHAVALIGEEHCWPSLSVAQEVARSREIRWIQMDMDDAERSKAGIAQKLLNRMQIRGYDAKGLPILPPRYAPKEDGMREQYWLDRIEEAWTGGSALVVCGCLHAAPLSEKAETRGHRIAAKLYHPEELSQLQAELF
jgi:hypothetical protein